MFFRRISDIIFDLGFYIVCSKFEKKKEENEHKIIRWNFRLMWTTDRGIEWHEMEWIYYFR